MNFGSGPNHSTTNYEDGELSDLEGEELKKSLKLVMEDDMERMGQRKRDQELTPYENRDGKSARLESSKKSATSHLRPASSFP